MALWKHECIRVISDRFTNQPDKDWFEKTMKRVIGEELGEDMQAMTENMPYLVDFLRFIPQLCFMDWHFPCRIATSFSFLLKIFIWKLNDKISLVKSLSCGGEGGGEGRGE